MNRIGEFRSTRNHCSFYVGGASVAEKRLLKKSSHFKGSDSVFLEQVLVGFRQERNDGQLVGGWDHVAERHVLEAFVLPNLVV